MTAIKAKPVDRTILDFSTGKYSKNKIWQSLRKCEIISSTPGIFYINTIKVGMYSIHLHLHYDSPDTMRTLKQYGDFEISIKDSRAIDLKNDGRFKYQSWVKNNFFGKLHIKHLVDIIYHTIRLNKLRCFL